MLLEMRPELIGALGYQVAAHPAGDAFIGRVRVPVALDIQGTCELTNEVKIVFYRVAQEALNNIAKHSGARQVKLRLECQPGQMNLSIKDDGLGFDPAQLPLTTWGSRSCASAPVRSGQFEDRKQPGQANRRADWRSTRKD